MSDRAQICDCQEWGGMAEGWSGNLGLAYVIYWYIEDGWTKSCLIYKILLYERECMCVCLYIYITASCFCIAEIKRTL